MSGIAKSPPRRPFFPFRGLFAAPPEDDPFLEVDVARMASAILAQDAPDLKRPFSTGAGLGWTVGQPGRGRNPPGIHA